MTPSSLGEDRGRPLEEKESPRWVDGFARVNALAETLTDTRLTYIADREGDIYDLFVEAPCPERGADWLVRVQHSDRLLVDGRKLREAIDAAPCSPESPSSDPSAMAGARTPSTTGSRPVYKQWQDGGKKAEQGDWSAALLPLGVVVLLVILLVMAVR